MKNILNGTNKNLTQGKKVANILPQKKERRGYPLNRNIQKK